MLALWGELRGADVSLGGDCRRDDSTVALVRRDNIRQAVEVLAGRGPVGQPATVTITVPAVEGSGGISSTSTVRLEWGA